MPQSSKKISQIHHRKTSGEGSFGMVTYRKGGKFGLRVQRDFQLVVIHRGSAEIRTDGQLVPLLKGQGVLLRPQRVEHFEFSRQEETRHSWCQIAPHLVPESMRFPEAVLLRPLPCSENVLEQIRLGLRLNLSGPAVSAQVLACMWTFCREAKTEYLVAPESAASITERFQRAMERSLAQEVTLADLARASGVSRGHLIKVVSEKWGATPMEIFWRHRTDAAAILLRETGLTVAEIAERTGFTNPYHLSRRFRQRYATSPRAWRLQCWNSGA